MAKSSRKSSKNQSRRTTRRSSSESAPSPQPISAGALPDPANARGQFTGKYLVLFRDDGIEEGLAVIKETSGLKDICSAADYRGGAVEMADAEGAEVFVLDKLKIAVVDADPTQVSGLNAEAATDGPILAVEPEQIMYALGALGDPLRLPLEYLRGYKDAIDHLYASLTGTMAEAGAEAVAAVGFADNAQSTWGLQASRVSLSPFSGRGVRIAVLDTGFDLNHPDFVGRTVNSTSFVPGQAVDDLNGHGTHCIGTSLGPQVPAGGVRRYGCAYRGDIFVGKVLSNQGSGSDSGILAGINWAVTNQCRVVSMSLGAPVVPGETFSTIYERIAQRALQSNPGTLIVAAAGNDSTKFDGLGRPIGRIEPPNPVGRPANCPSILAVAALDSNLGIARFSNGGINPNGGGVDIAGPGVAVFSSVPEPFPPAVQPIGPGRPWPPRYHTISGTSMATPHVAGIAAMWLESRGTATSSQALWQLLTGNALRLPLSSRDVGAGLVQAPV